MLVRKSVQALLPEVLPVAAFLGADAGAKWGVKPASPALSVAVCTCGRAKREAVATNFPLEGSHFTFSFILSGKD